ncbi:MAG: hypothetical protein ACI8TE_001434 [Francisella sp.]|jgi:hypothetical protein
MFKTLGLLTLISSGLYAVGVNDNWSDDYSIFKYVSASSIEKLGKNVESILPEVNSENVSLLSNDSILGKYGPIGPQRALGSELAANNNTPNINQYPALDKYYKSFFGPINKTLGERGPFTEESYYNGFLFQDSNFAVQIRSLGLWGILGPTGPLGPVGVLGPLGHHGYKKNENGDYIDEDNNIITEIDVPYDNESTRNFDLYEYYETEYASKKKDLDTSFVTKGDLGDNIDDKFLINNDQKQIITALVVPTNLYNHFDISLYNSKDKLIAKSNSIEYINFIQFTAPKNTSYILKVSSQDKSNEYMLYVTGSTEYLNKYNISGDHVVSK